MTEYIEVPITLGFVSGDIVGTVKILKSALPDKPNWVLSLGYKTLDNYELKELSLILDDNYTEYLRSK